MTTTAGSFAITTDVPDGFAPIVRVVALQGAAGGVESVVRHALESLLRHLMADTPVEHIVLDLDRLTGDDCLGPLLRRVTPGKDQKKWIVLVGPSALLSDWLGDHGLGPHRLPRFDRRDDALDWLRTHVPGVATGEPLQLRQVLEALDLAPQELERLIADGSVRAFRDESRGADADTSPRHTTEESAEFEADERERGITISAPVNEPVQKKVAAYEAAQREAAERREQEQVLEKVLRAEEKRTEAQREEVEEEARRRVRKQFDRAPEKPKPAPKKPKKTAAAKDVMDLREETGAKVMDAKQALERADGDADKAKAELRRSGIADARKKRALPEEDLFGEGGEALVADTTSADEAADEDLDVLFAAISFNGGDSDDDDDRLADGEGEAIDGLFSVAMDAEFDDLPAADGALGLGKRSAGRSVRGIDEFEPPDEKAPAEPQPELVEVIRKMATVRYFSQMNPDRVFPLSVRFTKEKMQEWVTKAVRQVSGDKHIEVTADDPFVTVRPRFPGCHVVPAEAEADLSLEETQAVFSISPFARGKLDDARVEILYRGEVVQTIATPTRITTQTLSRLTATASFLSPAYFMGLQAAGLDFQSQAASGFPLLQQLTASVGGLFNLGLLLGGLLLGAAGLFFWWKKPKKSDPLYIFYNGPGG